MSDLDALLQELNHIKRALRGQREYIDFLQKMYGRNVELREENDDLRKQIILLKKEIEKLRIHNDGSGKKRIQAPRKIRKRL